jgi:hypothetical protein
VVKGLTVTGGTSAPTADARHIACGFRDYRDMILSLFTTSRSLPRDACAGLGVYLDGPDGSPAVIVKSLPGTLAGCHVTTCYA